MCPSLSICLCCIVVPERQCEYPITLTVCSNGETNAVIVSSLNDQLNQRVTKSTGRANQVSGKPTHDVGIECILNVHTS